VKGEAEARAESNGVERVLLGLFVSVVVLALAGLWYGSRPPRPHLSLPDGMRVISVKGHCVEGSELFMCAPAGGPRSTLTLKVRGDSSREYERLRMELLANGWVDYSNMLCDARRREGCVQRSGPQPRDRVVLDWVTWVNPCDYAGCHGRSPIRTG
jgi:hypothetical protein